MSFEDITRFFGIIIVRLVQIMITMVIFLFIITFVVAIYFTIQLYILNWHLEKNHPAVWEKIKIKDFLGFRGEDLPLSANWVKEVWFSFFPDNLNDKYLSKLKTKTKLSFLLLIALMTGLLIIMSHRLTI